MRYYDELATYSRDGFDVIVDKTYEDLNPRDQFDWTEEELDQLIKDIDMGKTEWFMLRVRVFVEGFELGSAYLGGCLYEDPMEVLTDGTAEDLKVEAMAEAKAAVYPLMRKLQAINEAIEREGVTCG
jgi:hypothetical protein